MISCIYCTSFWVALLAALWPAETFSHLFGYALAFSAIAMLLEALLSKYTDPLTVVTKPAADD